MIIPWQVDVPRDRRPFFNWLLIAAAITAFVFQTISIESRKDQLPDKLREFENHSVEEVAEELGVSDQQLKEVEQLVDETYGEFTKTLLQKELTQDLKDQIIKEILLQNYFVWGEVMPFILDGTKAKGLFGHMWLHGGIIHLLGNMLFLWVFGNAVCAKIGNIFYLPLYIFLGLFAAAAHLIFQGGPAIGASGAIMGVVGMYLVFFPENDITCYFVLWFIREFTVSSYWMVLFWVAFDIYGAATGGIGIAYFAHLGGFFTGCALALLMLKTKWVEMNPRYERSILDLLARKKEPDEDKGMDPRFGWMLQQADETANETSQKQSTPATSAPPLKLTDPPTHTGELSPQPAQKSPPPAEAMIRFICPCGKRIKIPAKYAGKVGKCPACGKRLRIPDKK